MFDAKKFSDILKRIVEQYDSITDFTKTANVGRSYISKYIHLKMPNRPSPKVLLKIANASKGITTYEELMAVCGHINSSKHFNNELAYYKENNPDYTKIKNAFLDLSLTKEEIETVSEAFKRLDMSPSNYTQYNQVRITPNLDSNNSLSVESAKKIGKALSLLIKLAKIFFENSDCLRNNSIAFDVNNLLYENVMKDLLEESTIRIPIVGEVRAGYDYIVNENIIGYTGIPEKLSQTGEFFALKVKR